MASESDDSDLRERVAELEATVEQQQQTIRKMLPGRRGALKAGGLLAGGGLLGALGSDQVAAADGQNDTSVGQVGAAGDSTDIYLDELRGPGGDEILDVDDTGLINAQFGRTWAFDSVSLDRQTFTGSSQFIDTAEETLALGSVLNVSLAVSNLNFGFGVVTRDKAIGTALIEFQRFAPVINLIYDANGDFTTTQGNSGTTNIYYNSSDELVVENENQSDDRITVTLIAL